MDRSKLNEIQAVILFAVAILMFISLISFEFGDVSIFTSKVNHPIKNFAGIVGVYIGALLFFVMGLSAYVMPALVVSWALARLFGITPQKLYYKLFGTFFLILASSSLFSIMAMADKTVRFKLGGLLGLVFSDFLIKYLGRMGAMVVIGVLVVLSVLLATEFLLLPFLSSIFRNMKGLSDDIKELKGRIPLRAREELKGVKARLQARDAREEVKFRTTTPPVIKKFQDKDKDKAKQMELVADKKEERKPIVIKSPALTPQPVSQKERPAPKQSPAPAPVAKEPTLAGKEDAVEYKLPSIDLLDSPPPLEARKIQEDFTANAGILEETLRDFDIEAKVVEINQGPVITRYELEPAPGVKIQRVTSLSDNIALAMKAQSIRIVAPVPGKGTIGVEVPNSVSALVYLKDVLATKEYKESRGKIKLALGKDIAGTPVLADLTSMPHLLIAGATGSGKTVCINSVITSILLNYTPEEVRFIMVDPKRVELAIFNDMAHLLTPVVTDSKKAAGVLNWIVSEMDSRYELLAKAGVRNIALYNEKFASDAEQKLPYIVVVVDELADLMMVAQNDVESAITRLAQLSRAVGIHLIIATQRPSVDVITGVIKANLPARISFKVASKVDSRTVLDMNGADKLLGRGDMLFVEPGATRPTRGQCSLISDKEIERITSFIKTQRQPKYVEEISEADKKQAFRTFEKDEVYEEAVRLILETKQASVSVLQRRLGLGYTRAARLIDMMEDEGIVGPYQGSKPRDILISLEEYQAKNVAK